MLTTIDKAIAGGVVAFVANWALAHYHLAIPADLQDALASVIVACLVWAVPNKATT